MKTSRPHSHTSKQVSNNITLCSTLLLHPWCTKHF